MVKTLTLRLAELQDFVKPQMSAEPVSHTRPSTLLAAESRSEVVAAFMQLK